MAYDTNNIFAKILRGEIPCKKAYEDAHVLAFHDIRPLAPVHILVVPKGSYEHHQDFIARATDAEIIAFHRAINLIATEAGVAETGYRLISNTGPHSGQEVPHYHVHLLAAKQMGPLVV